MGWGGFKSVDLSANVFSFMVMNFAYLISASRLTERADIANGVSQRGARLCHEGYPHTTHFSMSLRGRKANQKMIIFLWSGLAKR